MRPVFFIFTAPPLPLSFPLTAHRAPPQYNVDVEFANGERRFKQKRFNEFSSLHAALLSLSARGESKDRAAQACWQEVSQFDFPHKTMTGGAWLRERRRRKFDQVRSPSWRCAARP